MYTMPDGTLPAYQLRISARARRVRLEISPGNGLVLVVPARFPLGRIPGILERHRAWIEATLARQARRPAPPPTPSWKLPAAIELPALGSSWNVAARATAARGVTVRASRDQRLTLAGRTTEEQACRAALGRWLVRQAQTHLPPRLEALSRQTGLRYAQVTIRRQQTRWGSCARGGRIALNARLLFLPSELVEYVCLHELCHTVHLNHSPAFWTLVHAYCPAAPLRRAALRAAGPLVPPWA
jgi:predicted metal-dependent hydrolase